MKLIVVDDTVENLNAAKEAARSFPEQEFVFTSSASEALTLLPDADGVVTDLFFPPEGHMELESPLFMPYNNFYGATSEAGYEPAFGEVVNSYYRGDEHMARDKHLAALDLINKGTIRGALEDLIRVIVRQGRSADAEEYRVKLKNLPPLQFPYGAALMLAAKKIGKRHVLVSDIHRHAGDFKSASSAVDAMVLLLALIAKGIMNIEEVTYDGKNSHTYLGSDRIRELAGEVRPAKTSPAVWVEAIRLALNNAG